MVMIGQMSIDHRMEKCTKNRMDRGVRILIGEHQGALSTKNHTGKIAQTFPELRATLLSTVAM